MGELKFGVSLDAAPEILREIILQTLAEVRDLRIVHIPAGGFAPDCLAVVLVGHATPEAHLRGKVECVVNIHPGTAHSLLYRADAAVRRIDRLPVKTLLEMVTTEFKRGRANAQVNSWNPFAWFGKRAELPEAGPMLDLSAPEEPLMIGGSDGAVTAELARLATRMAQRIPPRRGGEGPARELGELLRGLAASDRGNLRLRPLDDLCELFRLEPDERDLLFLASVVEIEPLAARLVALVNDHLSRHRPSVGIVASWGGDPRTLVERLIGGGALLRYGLIALEGDGPVATRTVIADRAVWPILFDMERTPPFATARFGKADNRAEGLAAPTEWKRGFAKSIETIRKMPCDEIFVSVAGDEDSGRNEIARAIAAQLGPTSITVDGSELGDDAARGAVLREAAIAGATVIMTNPERVPAAQFKALSEALATPLIVIAPGDRLAALALNGSRAMVRIATPERDHRQRVRLWKSEAAEGWSQGDVAAIADRFDFGRRRIVVALASARAQAATEGRKTVELGDAARACAVLREASFDGSAEQLECRFAPDEIVLRDETQRELDLAIAWARHGSRLFGKSGKAEPLHAGGGLACLFTGPPGTGKTMAAQIVARQVDYALYRVDLSQVIDKYIGEGEKRISSLFRQARRSRVALFFDEADALFGKRTEVKDSHDRYANIAVNHLLQELEGFDGLSILATNFAANIDAAFMRRIRVRADFPAPNAAERLQIWERLLSTAVIEGSDIDVARLAGDYDLVGGEIRNAIYTAHLLAAEDKAAKRVAMCHCLAGLAREIGKTGRVVDAAMLR